MSQVENTSTLQILEEHRKMVLFTGSISDFQLANLKKWPSIVLGNDKFSSITISYNFGGNGEPFFSGEVTYNVKLKKGVKISKEDKKQILNTLSLWVKTLFWEDTKVSIITRGEAWS